MKVVSVDPRALKELKKFSDNVYLKFIALFELLEEEGFLYKPLAKKLKSHKNLFELRVKSKGQFRSLYAYIGKGEIIILSVFNKKGQKTLVREINKAIKRLRNYL